MKKLKFPSNPFSIVNPKDFWKSFKKKFSEDYVQINFHNAGWNVYEPFQDIGTDRVASRFVCNDCHKKSELSETINCSECENEKFKIIRFIQIKTREVSEENNSTFGYTLRSKDFIPDPRVTFLFFSDYTNDFIIFLINDYLDLIKNTLNACPSHFHTPSFKFDNNKINSIHFNGNQWSYNSGRGRAAVNFNLGPYMNEKGLLRIMNPDVDHKNYVKLMQEIVDFRRDNFFEMTGGRTFSDDEINLINSEIKKFLNSPVSTKKNTFLANKNKFDNLDDDIKNSIKKYEKDLYNS
jgi:hypothetical protein